MLVLRNKRFKGRKNYLLKPRGGVKAVQGLVRLEFINRKAIAPDGVIYQEQV
jgi:hypothetical protein